MKQKIIDFKICKNGNVFALSEDGEMFFKSNYADTPWKPFPPLPEKQEEKISKPMNLSVQDGGIWQG